MAAIDRKGNITACVGDDINLVFTITDPGGAYSWTGATVVTTIVGPGGVASSSNFTTVTAAGTLTLTLSDTATTTLGAGPFRYAITVTKNGDSQTWLGAVLSLAVPVYAPTTLTVALAITVTTATVALTISGGVAGAEGGTTALTTDGDILTRTAGVPARITRANLAADTAFTARFASFFQVAANVDEIITGAITRDGNGAATSAGVVWPDATTGTYTATSVSTAFPGAVDAYTVTYGAGPTYTYTQAAVTRDANGAVINRPAIVRT